MADTNGCAIIHSKVHMAKITAKDVAKLAKVDVSAVSRVLNQATANHHYSSATVKRIHAAAEKLGYQPSMTARALRTGKTMLVGMLVSDIANPFFSELAACVERLAWQHGYRVVICSTNEDAQRQNKQINDLISRGIDGLIISPTSTVELKKFNSVVAIDRPAIKTTISYVGLNNQKAGHLLGQHLTEKQYRKVGVITPLSKGDPTLKYRYEGLLAGLGSDRKIAWVAGIPANVNILANVRAETIKQLKKFPQTDAVVGMTNWCTLGALEALAELRMAWGKDIGLAGIDDFAAAALLQPSVTVVAQPIEDIANKAFQLLLKCMNGYFQKKQTFLVEPVWLERGSLPKNK